MKKNSLPGLIVICVFSLFNCTACAQQHKSNQQKLSILQTISQNAVVLNNHDSIVPLKHLDKKTIASIDLGFEHQNVFDSLLNKYAKVVRFSAQPYAAEPTLNNLEDELKYYNTVLIAIPSGISNNARYINMIQSLSASKQVIVSLFGQASSLKSFDAITAPLIWTDQQNAEAASIVPQIIFGGIAASKKLSYPISPKYTQGSGFSTVATRLKYTLPEDAGVNADDLKEIDQIAAEAIRAKAAPGMVVLVAKDGKVIFNKAYGDHTYDGTVQDQVTDIFDLASLTKTTATTPTIMRLVEQNKLNLDTNLGAYIPKVRLLPMNEIKVREVMLHQAGFVSYIPFHNSIKEGDYSLDSSAAYPTKVADHFYIKKGFFRDVMWERMINSPIKTRGQYVYSDISMYVMQDIAERISQVPLNQYVQDQFYRPLGMQTAGFLPRNRFAKEQIVPTENDTYFRKTLLEGYVHDQGAGLAGGVAGHAGLFASANDIAIIYQMLLNRGTYGGEQYFKAETVNKFITKQSAVSRRGLGFDRWDPRPEVKYPSELASDQTFGHTGYTGTCVWVDPSRGLVYVFLSNRVHPSVSEQLGKLSIRPRIQDVINKAIDKGNKQ
jgi:CubicO group peptidase (beta-lactamase class C family)